MGNIPFFQQDNPFLLKIQKQGDCRKQSKHQYFKKVLDPLKSASRLEVFAISIELLISSFSLEMDRLILDNPDKYEDPLNRFLLQVSSRLEEFINDSNLKIEWNEEENQE